MHLSGIFAPIPTPFDDRDRVDTGRLKAALAKWVRRPLTGFVVLGSNGEAALMDDFESDQAIVAARETIPRDMAIHRRHRPRVDAGGDQGVEARGASTAPTRCWCARPGSSRAR